MAVNIKTLLVSLGLKSDEYHAGLDKADKAAHKTGASIVSGLGTAGKFAAAALASGVVAGVGLIAGATIHGIGVTQEWAGTLDNLGDVLGTNARESAALAVAIQGVGGNVEGIASQMTILTRGLVNAKGEIGPTGKVLQGLGIDFQDANGKIKPTTEILTSVADKIAAMPDGLEKTALMTDLFGKSGKDLSDVMAALANGGLAKADEKAKALGLSMGEDAVRGSIDLGKQFANLKMLGQGLFVTLGTQLLPIITPLITQFANWGISVMPQVAGAISTVVGWLSSLTEIVRALVTGDFRGGIFGLMEDDPFILALFQFRDILVSVADFLKDNWEPIFVGVLAALTVAIGVFVYTTVIPAAIATIAALAPIILPLLAIAAVVALLYAAWKNNWGGIRDITQAVASWIVARVQAFLNLVQGFWDAHGAAIMAAAKNAWGTIQTVIDGVLKVVGFVFAAFKAAFQGDWYGFGENLRKAWDTMWATIKRVAETTWENLKTLFSNVVTAIVNFFKTTDWGAVGRGIIEGIKSGVVSAANLLAEAAIAAAKAALEAVKGFLGIRSPSTVFAGLGEMSGRGFALGVLHTLPDIQRTVALTLAAGVQGGMGGNTSYTYNLNGSYRYESEESQIEKLKLLQRLKG